MRLKNYSYPNEIGKPFKANKFNVIHLQNNFIDEFNFWLLHKKFNLIMFENCIFYNTLAKDIYLKYKLIK